MSTTVERAKLVLAEPWQHPVLRDVMTKLVADVERMEAWVADLQSGMYVNCVYCGHRYGPALTTPVSMADQLKAHIARCPEHPMAELLGALRAQHEVVDILLAVVIGYDKTFLPSKSAIWPAIERSAAAIRKASGGVAP